MLGYDAVNGALQSLGVREQVSSYLSIYFLLSYPSFNIINKEFLSIEKFTDFYFEKFKKETLGKNDEGLTSLKLLYLAAIFDINPKYDFAQHSPKKNPSCEILKEGEDYLREIFKETLNELVGIEIAEKGAESTYESYLSNLKVLNIPTANHVIFPHSEAFSFKPPGKEQYESGKFFEWKEPKINVHGIHYGNPIGPIEARIHTVQRPGVNINLKNFNFFNTQLPSTSDSSFLENNEKFFFEFYFFGDRNIRLQRHLSFEEVFMIKDKNRDFVVTGMGVRLMTFLSPEELSSKPYKTWFKDTFPIWNENSFSSLLTKTKLGYVSTPADFSSLVKENNKTAINIISETEGLVFDKTMVVHYDTQTSNNEYDPNRKIHTRFPVILKVSEITDPALNGLFESTFKKIDSLSPGLQGKIVTPDFNAVTNVDSKGAGNEAEILYDKLYKEVEKLVNSIKKDDSIKNFFTKIIPIETLLTIGPIYYSSLAEETGKREELRTLDGFIYKDYLKSIDALLVSLSKFDEM